MPPSRRTRDDNFETVHVWPKTAEREQFITQEYHPNGVVSGYATYGVNDATPTEPAPGASASARPRSKSFGLAWWTIEILAMVLSICSMIAIVIVLRVYDGQAVLELNLPSGLTLNAIIAALSTISRAALMVPVAATLMQELWLFFSSEAKKKTCSSRLSDLHVFDSASRGLVGSAKLLVHPRGRRIVAATAALITILSLAFGTFAQQAITYSGLVDLSSSSQLTPGNIPRTETWTQTMGRPSEGFYSPPFDFIAAFYNGVLTGNGAPAPIPCQSGNCTWPSTPSLAICGGCVQTKPVKSVCYVQEQNYFYCNYTLPSGSEMRMWDFDKRQDADGGAGFQVVASTGAHFNASKGNRAYVTNFDLMGAPYLSNDTYDVHNKDMKAAECAMWMCVQTYNTSISAGQQTETVISQIDDIDVHDLLYTGFPGAEDPATYRETVKFKSVPRSEDPEGKTSFTVDAGGLMALRLYVNEKIDGNITFYQEVAGPSSDLMYGIWNGTVDLDDWITNVAKSVSNVLRTTDSVSYPQYNGTAQGLGVHVRWLWLLLPLLLVLLSLVILIVTMVRTSLSPVEAWKGSPLTFLLFGVDNQIRGEAYGQGSDHNGFRNAVGETQVRLVEDGGTFWKFKPC